MMDDYEEPPLSPVLLKVLAMEPTTIAPTGTEIHWACPDCGSPCRCVGFSRELPHVHCGRGPE
jgi:hypothetical protein